MKLKVVKFKDRWEVADDKGFAMESFASREEAETALAEFAEAMEGAAAEAEDRLVNSPVHLDGNDWSDRWEE